MTLAAPEKILLLRSLRTGPGYALEVIERVKTLSVGLVVFHPGNIYPALRSLELEGLVESYSVEENMIERDGRPRCYYRLTKKGELQLKTELFAVVEAEAARADTLTLTREELRQLETLTIREGTLLAIRNFSTAVGATQLLTMLMAWCGVVDSSASSVTLMSVAAFAIPISHLTASLERRHRSALLTTIWARRKVGK